MLVLQLQRDPGIKADWTPSFDHLTQGRLTILALKNYCSPGTYSISAPCKNPSAMMAVLEAFMALKTCTFLLIFWFEARIKLQLLTLLSQLPAIKKFWGMDGGLNCKQVTESSGGGVTSKSFIGLVDVDATGVAPNDEPPLKPWENIFA